MAPQDVPKRAGPAPKYDWETHKDTIVRLYEEKGYQPMAKEMEEIGFAPSRRTYLNKLKEWGVEKNVPSTKMKFMAEKATKRKAENKETVFIWQGKRVPAHKIERFQRRRKGADDSGATGDDESPNDAPTPAGIHYRSPSPAAEEDVYCRGHTIAAVLNTPPLSHAAANSSEDRESCLPVARVTTEKAQGETDEGGLYGRESVGEERDDHPRTGGDWRASAGEDARSQTPSPTLWPETRSSDALDDSDFAALYLRAIQKDPDCNPWSYTADPRSMLNDDADFYGDSREADFMTSTDVVSQGEIDPWSPIPAINHEDIDWSLFMATRDLTLGGN